jgi:hypothetical protein
MATAKAITRPTQAQWQARAIELAEAAHLTGTARQLAGNSLHEFWGVRKSGPVGEYSIHVWRIGGELRSITCTCVAGEHCRACKHVGAVLHSLRMRERALANTQDDAWSWWMKGGEW